MLSQLFVIQKPTKIDNGIGGFKDTWGAFEKVSGYLDLLTGTDLTTAQNAITEQSTHILIVTKFDKLPLIDDTMRVIAGNKFYPITFVDDPAGQGHHLEIYLSYGGVVDDI